MLFIFFVDTKKFWQARPQSSPQVRHIFGIIGHLYDSYKSYTNTTLISTVRSNTREYNSHIGSWNHRSLIKTIVHQHNPHISSEIQIHINATIAPTAKFKRAFFLLESDPYLPIDPTRVLKMARFLFSLQICFRYW